MVEGNEKGRAGGGNTRSQRELEGVVRGMEGKSEQMSRR